MLKDFIKNNKRSAYLLVFYFILMLIIAFFWPKQIDWRASYSALHTKPYGARVLFNELSHLYPEASFESSNMPIYNTVHDSFSVDANTVYVFCDQNFYIDSLEFSRLYSFVEQGNTAFIAAEKIEEKFLDTLHLTLDSEFKYNIENDSSAFSFMDARFPKYVFPNNRERTYLYQDSAFVGNQHSYIDFEDQMNQVMVPFGKGKFILNSNPLGFTNFYILNDSTRNYAANCLSFIGNVEHIIWDEYYKVGKPGASKTPLKEILQIPGLRWAYWLSLITILLFIGFHSKRKQRIIPLEEPIRNTSLEYVDTMGNLYFEQSTNKNIANKKIDFFKSYLARAYNLNNIDFLDKDLKRIQNRTNKTEVEIQQLFEVIQLIKTKKKVDALALKKLNTEINNFYK